jgi:hypothetical protein
MDYENIKKMDEELKQKLKITTNEYNKLKKELLKMKDNKMSSKQIKDILKKRGIKGISGLNKDDLTYILKTGKIRPIIEEKIESKLPINIINERYELIKKYPVVQLRAHFKNIIKSKDKRLRVLEKISKLATNEEMEKLGPIQRGLTSKNILSLVDKKAKVYKKDQQEEFMKKEDAQYNIIEGNFKGIINGEQVERKIELKEHQIKFLVHFFFSGLQAALLFHGTGTGKTFTAVATSYFFLKLKPNGKVIFISPPSLIENFLRSMHYYGLDIRDNRYLFMSYEKAINYYKKRTEQTVNDISNTLILIDEAHYLRTKIETKEDKGIIYPTQNMRGFYINKLTRLSIYGKVILMTATPFINKIYDIENLMATINYVDPVDENTFYQITTSISSTIDYFKYKISHFEIPSAENPNDLKYPRRVQTFVPLKLTGDDAKAYNDMINNSGTSETINNLDIDPLVKKQYSNIAKADVKVKKAFYNAARDISITIGGLKMEHLEKTIKGWKRTGKFIIYSIFTGMSKPRKERMVNEETGEVVYFEKNKGYGRMSGGSEEEEKAKKGIRYIIEQIYKIPNIKIYKITGDESLTQRKDALRDYNYDRFDENNNIIVENIKVLIISDAGTEGLDCKNTEGIFLMEPLWNESRSEQAIARAIRFQSHQQLKNEWRYVNVYRYVVCTQEQEENLIKKINESKITEVIQDYNKFVEMKKKLQDFRNQLSKQNKEQIGGGDMGTAVKLKKLASKLPEFQLEQYKKLKSQEERQKYLNEAGVATRYETDQLQREMSKIIDKLPGPEIMIVLLSISKQATILKFVETLDKEVARVEDIENGLINEYLRNVVNKQYPKIGKNEVEKIRNTTFNLKELMETGETLTRIKKHYDKKIEDKIKNWDIKKKQQYFTPTFVLDKICDSEGNGYLKSFLNLSNEEFNNLNFDLFLEPSAGSGNILYHFLTNNIFSNKIKTFHAVEYDDELRKALKERSLKLGESVLQVAETKNFLSFLPSDRYNLIIMNPPFNLRPRTMDDLKGTFVYDKSIYDLDFVMRAYYLLKENGVLIALVYGPHVTNYNLYKEGIRKSRTGGSKEDIKEETENVKKPRKKPPPPDIIGKLKYDHYAEWLFTKDAEVTIEQIKGWDGKEQGLVTDKKSGKIPSIGIGFIRIKRSSELYKKEIETKEDEDYLSLNYVLTKEKIISAEKKEDNIIPNDQIKEYAQLYTKELKDNNIISVTENIIDKKIIDKKTINKKNINIIDDTEPQEEKTNKKNITII